jgi:hypothetical protein
MPASAPKPRKRRRGPRARAEWRPRCGTHTQHGGPQKRAESVAGLEGEEDARPAEHCHEARARVALQAWHYRVEDAPASGRAKAGRVQGLDDVVENVCNDGRKEEATEHGPGEVRPRGVDVGIGWDMSPARPCPANPAHVYGQIECVLAYMAGRFIRRSQPLEGFRGERPIEEAHDQRE